MTDKSATELHRTAAGKLARLGGFISIGLFLASLPLTGFTAGSSDWPGYGILFFGLFGVFLGEPANLLWICNPLLFVAWATLFTRQAGLALGFSGVALVGGLLFLACRLVLVSEAGGNGYEITSIGAGYWLWITSMLAAAGAAAHALTSTSSDDIP